MLPQKSPCGKTVHAMCITLWGAAHFSLAPFASISDNPALTKSGCFGPANPAAPRTSHGLQKGI
jgi:hypothetical protein